MAAVDGNQRRGALDLFNVPQARFFNRSLLVELGAQRPIHNIADQTSSDWAQTQPWGRRSKRSSRRWRGLRQPELLKA